MALHQMHRCLEIHVGSNQGRVCAAPHASVKTSDAILPSLVQLQPPTTPEAAAAAAPPAPSGPLVSLPCPLLNQCLSPQTCPNVHLGLW